MNSVGFSWSYTNMSNDCCHWPLLPKIQSSLSTFDSVCLSRSLCVSECVSVYEYVRVFRWFVRQSLAHSLIWRLFLHCLAYSAIAIASANASLSVVCVCRKRTARETVRERDSPLLV